MDISSTNARIEECRLQWTEYGVCVYKMEVDRLLKQTEEYAAKGKRDVGQSCKR